jgi:hypothetical protein
MLPYFALVESTIRPVFIDAVSVLITDPLVTPLGCWVVLSNALGVDSSLFALDPPSLLQLTASIKTSEEKIIFLIFLFLVH